MCFLKDIIAFSFMDNLVFSNMMHRPARTAVSILGIAIGILLIIFTKGMADGSFHERAVREGNVGAEIIFSGAGKSILSADSMVLPASVKPEIAATEGVEKVVSLGQNTVKASGDQNSSNLGSRLIDAINFEEYADVVGIKILDGRAFQPGSDEAIMDSAFQNQRKLKIGDKLNMYERDFTIVGVYEPAAGARVKIPLATMQNQLVGDESKVSSFLVKIKRESFTPEQVAQNLQNRFPDNQILLTSQLEELYVQSVPALGVFLNVVVGVAAAISALVILLTMYTTVTERTRQIGIMKSLGMSNASIGWIITQEALLISFFGVIGGVALTFIVRFLLKQVMTIEVAISFPLVIVTLIVGLIGGALGALYPAMKAARLDAVEALSYE